VYLQNDSLTRTEEAGHIELHDGSVKGKSSSAYAPRVSPNMARTNTSASLESARRDPAVDGQGLDLVEVRSVLRLGVSRRYVRPSVAM